VARQDRARRAAIVWNEGDNAKVVVGLDRQMAGPKASTPGRPSSATRTAPVKAGARRLSQARSRPVYSYPYQNHATLEPLNAPRSIPPTSARSGAERKRRGAAFAATLEASGFRPTNARVYKQMVGGWLRPSWPERLRPAARLLIAKEMPGTPVKIVCGRAKKTCSTAAIIPSRKAS